MIKALNSVLVASVLINSAAAATTCQHSLTGEELATAFYDHVVPALTGYAYNSSEEVRPLLCSGDFQDIVTEYSPLSVECGDDDTLMSLAFDNLNLPMDASIPTQIGLFTSLKQVTGYDSSHTGGIPSQIGCLGGLEYIEVVDTQLGGAIPSQIGLLQKLTVLAIENCDFTSLPDEVGDLTMLQTLAMSDNKFSQTLPAAIGSIESLVYLAATDSGFSGTIPQSLFENEMLTVLALDNNYFSGVIPTMAGEKLFQLSLGNNCLEGFDDMDASNVTFNDQSANPSTTGGKSLGSEFKCVLSAETDECNMFDCSALDAGAMCGCAVAPNCTVARESRCMGSSDSSTEAPTAAPGPSATDPPMDPSSSDSSDDDKDDAKTSAAAGLVAPSLAAVASLLAFAQLK